MEITWDELKGKILNINIIDIREKYLFNLVKIKNSKNVPYQFLIINPGEYLDKKQKYYILCEYGHKSKIVSELLNKEGFNTMNIKGGIEEYKKIVKG